MKLHTREEMDLNKDSVANEDGALPEAPHPRKEPYRASAKKRRTAPLWVAIVCLAVACAAVAGFSITYFTPLGGMDLRMVEALYSRGYYPVKETMETCGFLPYKEENPLAFASGKSGVAITVIFDFEAGICTKKGYTFALEDKYIVYAETEYLHKSVLEAITNQTLSIDKNGNVAASAVEYMPHGWATDYPPLIAHAGGVLRKARTNQSYSNGLKALIQNYDLGHRIFEFDFLPTTDGGLAVVHSGMVPESGDGIDMTQNEWLQYTGIGDISPMLIGDVLDQMLINGDMFLVTDTKRENTSSFEIIRKEAEARDPALLNRIIPQIYNMGMYNSLMEVYPFQSVIFTTYSTTDSPKEVVAFCQGTENIRVITVNVEDKALMSAYIEATRDTDILIYGFTVNTYNDITTQRQQGVWGLYTDYLLPSDYLVYESLQ